MQQMQVLTHALPVKLDRTNCILSRIQMENVISPNGFEEHIEGTKVCPPKTRATGHHLETL